ncbi:MAG: MFS transporter [Clostridiales bacterium]|jgi:MFS family permease|nr:MFS transporter [Clostridiales bacterium]MDR2090965.1 MFS transporter [Clostridiales bacterium]
MNEQRKYRLNYILYQIGVMFFPYIALFLKAEGYNGLQYGAVMAFTPLVTAAALPFFGMIDNGSGGRKILVYTVSALIIAAEFLMVGVNRLSLIIAAVFAASAAKAAYNTSIDSVTTVYAVETGKEFSSFRSFSSLGYILANIIGAFMFDAAGFHAILIVSAAANVAFCIGWSALKPLALDAEPKKKEHNYRLLLTNKPYLMFLVYQTLCFTMLTFVNNYDIIYQNMRGMPSYLFGVMTAVRVGFEILTFFILSRMKKTSYKAMLAAAPLFLLAQSAAYYAMTPAFSIYFLMAVSGAGSGLVIYANNKYLNKIVRPRNVTVGLYIAAVVQNLSVGIATLAGGAAIDRFGIKYLFLGSAAVLAAAFVFTCAFVKNEKFVKFAG